MSQTSNAKKYEEWAYVLDFLPQGRPTADRMAFRSEPTALLIGEAYFTLLEAVAKEGVRLAPGERIYVGKDRREKIKHITRRISYEDLTTTAKEELAIAVLNMVKNQEFRFIQFFNEAQAITPRMNALELIPGIGKKLMWQILSARENKEFEGFADLKKRTGIPDPATLLTKRILEELMEETKYRLFTRSG